jgi:hypothetical protein
VAEKVREGIPGLQGRATVGHGQTNRCLGASGYRHQIDVSVESATVLLLVECKCWNKQVDPEAILAHFGRRHDIEQAPGGKRVVAALATVKGFGPGAVQLADYFRVELWKVKNIREFVCRVEGVLSVGLPPQFAGLSNRVMMRLVGPDGVEKQYVDTGSAP